MEKQFLAIEKILLQEEKPSIFIEKLLKSNNLSKYPFNMIADLNNIQQNPKYHPEGNVFKHVMMVIDEGVPYREKVTNKRAFMWALLLHDIGKTPTTKMRKGRLTSYDHDKVGAVMAREFMEYFNEDEEFTSLVSSLVRWHMQSLYVNKNLPFKEIDKMVSELNINDIVLFSLADRLGRGGVDKEKRKEIYNDIEKFRRVISKSNE
ncbi:HD domain-containing protein [Clostridium bornimense]|uniref:HDIG domain-containing metalloprotein n=1 Tax=Clostridium bornimense TaxID=1216932 RepID=UPI001C110DEE|nr:HD domain-containing protein [Clostridium bornimense]MBU5316630.1 HD domain-containing protein [Clostridium bornimense]